MSAGDGDGWVVLPDGTRRWGRYGASGLLLHSAETTGTGHVLLQHRAWWSHHGGTWGVPGGAIDSSESTVQAALREFGEEVHGELGEIALNGVHRQDFTVWRYDTVLARSAEQGDFTPGNSESADIRWVPVDEVAGLRLLPAFEKIWPEIREALTQRLLLVVDATAAIGEPDGSPANPAETAARLRGALVAFAAEGVGTPPLPEGLPLAGLHRWFPRVVLVTAGEEPGPPTVPGVDVVPGGDADTVVSLGRDATSATLTVTARPEVRERLAAAGASTVAPDWLHTALGTPLGSLSATASGGPDR